MSRGEYVLNEFTFLTLTYCIRKKSCDLYISYCYKKLFNLYNFDLWSFCNNLTWILLNWIMLILNKTIYVLQMIWKHRRWVVLHKLCHYLIIYYIIRANKHKIWIYILTNMEKCSEKHFPIRVITWLWYLYMSKKQF